MFVQNDIRKLSHKIFFIYMFDTNGFTSPSLENCENVSKATQLFEEFPSVYG